jgi:hypothetical protein
MEFIKELSRPNNLQSLVVSYFNWYQLAFGDSIQASVILTSAENLGSDLIEFPSPPCQTQQLDRSCIRINQSYFEFQKEEIIDGLQQRNVISSTAM